MGAIPPPARRSTPGAKWQPPPPQDGEDAPPAKEAQARRRPGMPLELMISQDPTQLFNKHHLRGEQFEALVVAQQNFLSSCRSDSALLRQSGGRGAGGGYEVPSPKFDRLPPADSTGNTESQLQFYAKSLEKGRLCGNFKDPKNGRPFDAVYLHREAMCKQKHLVT